MACLWNHKKVMKTITKDDSFSLDLEENCSNLLDYDTEVDIFVSTQEVTCV